MEGAILDAGGEGGILEHRVVLANDLRGQARARLVEALELGIAPLGRDIMHDDGAKRIDVEAAIVIDRDVEFMGRDPGGRKARRERPQGEIFHEGDGVELMSPGRHAIGIVAEKRMIVSPDLTKSQRGVEPRGT